jgi:hypothetical protein
MPTRSAVETAQHVCAQANELARMSREAGLVTLAYWLEVAAFEAESQLKGGSGKIYTLDQSQAIDSPIVYSKPAEVFHRPGISCIKS